MTPFVPAQPAPASADEAPQMHFGGWAELYYAYNLNAPSNGLNATVPTSQQHDHIGFNNLALDLGWSFARVRGRVVTQLGAIVAEAYPPAATLARAQQDLLWRVLQEVTIGYEPRLLGRAPLLVEMGLFAVPFGVERVQIYKNWSWTSSNLFSMAPFQVTGVRARWTFNERLSVRAGIYSGWDRVIDDNNRLRSGMVEARYAVGDDLDLTLKYMFGVERDSNAREGLWVRHTLDHTGEVRVGSRVRLRWQAFGGLEPNRVGVSAWVGAAVYARVRIFEWLYAAGRLDAAYEWVPEGSVSLFDLNDASAYGSGTVTVEALPHAHLSLRVEYRHDVADGHLYYRNNVEVDPMRGAIRNAAYQDILLAGVTAWF
jgi:hypothetical protein